MKFGTETPKSMQFSHKSNVNFQKQKYGTSTDLATLTLYSKTQNTQILLFEVNKQAVFRQCKQNINPASMLITWWQRGRRTGASIRFWWCSRSRRRKLPALSQSPSLPSLRLGSAGTCLFLRRGRLQQMRPGGCNQLPRCRPPSSASAKIYDWEKKELSAQRQFTRFNNVIKERAAG
jgi:hypothetical protein